MYLINMEIPQIQLHIMRELVKKYGNNVIISLMQLLLEQEQEEQFVESVDGLKMLLQM